MPRKLKLSGRKASTESMNNPKKKSGRPKKKANPRKIGQQKKVKRAAVDKTYSTSRKVTGGLGGNANGGAIYGELTQGYMQQVCDFLIKHTGLGESSRFIDVGCGLGKPNNHVATYAGVEFSFGLEYVELRANLGLVVLEKILEEAKTDENIGRACLLQHGDIADARSFDPFTHVYQYDVG